MVDVRKTWSLFCYKLENVPNFSLFSANPRRVGLTRPSFATL